MFKKLFTFESLDYIDDLAVVYYDCELLEQLGDYPKGTKFKSIYVNYDNGILELQDDGHTDEDGITDLIEVAKFSITPTLTKIS